MADEVINTCKSLILPKEANATIIAVDATAEMGSIFYDTDNNKVMFVTTATNSETLDSA